MNTGTELLMKPGLVHELFKILKKLGATDHHVEHMTDPRLTQQFIAVINGTATVHDGSPIIDCQEYVRSSPFPGKVQVLDHQVQRPLKWDKGVMVKSLFQTPEQVAGEEVAFEEVMAQLKAAGKEALNASPVAFLIERRWLIPEEWQGIRVLFPMTVFGRSSAEAHHYDLIYPGYWRHSSSDLNRKLGKKDFIVVRPPDEA